MRLRQSHDRLLGAVRSLALTSFVVATSLSGQSLSKLESTMFRQPYFRHKRLFNDYVNRLSFIMSQGRHGHEAGDYGQDRRVPQERGNRYRHVNASHRFGGSRRQRRADGKPGSAEAVVSSEGVVRLAEPAVEGTLAALRVEQDQGRYAGAAFRSPIRLGISQGEISLGDWSKKGLLSYSGIGVYTAEIQVSAPDKDVQWVLDLGEVKTSAEVILSGESLGARAWAPYRFDLSQALREGENVLQGAGRQHAR